MYTDRRGSDLFGALNWSCPRDHFGRKAGGEFKAGVAKPPDVVRTPAPFIPDHQPC